MNKDLEKALKTIEKQFGTGTAMVLGDNHTLDVERVPSGSLKLDSVLGGGYPLGRIVEIYGPESSGKTTLALHAIAEVQKTDKMAAIIDVEHAIDPEYAQNLGVDLDKLIISQPSTGEQALEVCEALIRSGGVGIVVIDSVAALTPQAEIEGQMGDRHIAGIARLMSQAMRKLTAVANETNTLLIFINQVRINVGTMYGNPETTPGGNALKFAASQRIRIARAAAATITDTKVSANVKVIKNKVAPPFKTTVLDLEFGKGVVAGNEILDLAVEYGIVERKGSWFYYGEERLGQGADNVKILLKEKPELLKDLETKVREALTK